MRPIILLIFLSSTMLTGCLGSGNETSSAVKSGTAIAATVNVVP